MARQSRLPFPERTTLTTKIFEILHVNLWRPYHIATHDRHKYFITFVDDYNRCTWANLLSYKSNALQTIKAFFAMVRNQFSISVKTIRTDNDTDFTSLEATSFFQS